MFAFLGEPLTRTHPLAEKKKKMVKRKRRAPSSQPGPREPPSFLGDVEGSAPHSRRFRRRGVWTPRAPHSSWLVSEKRPIWWTGKKRVGKASSFMIPTPLRSRPSSSVPRPSVHPFAKKGLLFSPLFLSLSLSLYRGFSARFRSLPIPPVPLFYSLSEDKDPMHRDYNPNYDQSKRTGSH